MQFSNLTTDPSKDHGITWAWQQYNSSQPETVQVGADPETGAPIMGPNPARFATAFDYAVARIGSMIDSWAQQADAAAVAPSAPAPGSVSADWRPQAITDLNTLRAKILSILTSMQTDYTAREEIANAAACLDAKQLVKVIETAPAVQAAYDAQPGARADFDAAVKARWLEIVAPAPLQVKADFNKYGGNTV